MDKSIPEQIEDIKADVCKCICKWMDKANRAHYDTTEDIEKMNNTMHEICEQCPLTRL